MLVAVGTLNPSKLEGVKRAFSEVYGRVEVVGVKVEGLKPQPIGLEEIVEGAKRRALHARGSFPGCDFAVGVEAGIFFAAGVPLDVQAAYVVSGSGGESLGFSPAFPLPRRFVDGLLGGRYRELEEAADEHFGTSGIGEKGGLVKLLTKSRVTREDLTYYAVLMALIPFENRSLY